MTLNDNRLGIVLPNFINNQTTKINTALAQCKPYDNFFADVNCELLKTAKEASNKLIKVIELIEKIHHPNTKELEAQNAEKEINKIIEKEKS